ncbi:EAL domain-containing protein [Sulfuricurvum sp.]|uniref:EAL domain-containing protein n=1 Tax=Sulfuricurvum sp. TaxID=2025608 RepID=UPI002E36E865|nr:EAL domain-containing protein [Sulfuricurvum sp.]HEX5328725.1 EAL domain-containing protein [Sulfuricurvum sp.]
MKQVLLQSILSHNVTTLNPVDTVAKALELMADYAISSVVVTDGENHPIGIFTEHDALKVVAEAIETSAALNDVMTRNPFCVVQTMQMHDAYGLMEEKHFRHLIVIDEDGHFVGVITEGDFLRHIGLEHLTKFKTVAEAMSESPLIVELKTSLLDAASMMNERKCDYAIVLNGAAPIGVITERDIAHRCARDNHVSQELVESLFHSDIVIIGKDIALHHAAAMMEEHGVHQLIVVDAQGNLSGILTRHDVLHAVHGAYFEYLIRVIDEKSAAIARISERKRAIRTEKEEVEKNATKLRKLFEALPDGVVLIDTATLCAVEFNQAAHEHLGYTAEEFAVLSLSDYETIESPEETHRRIEAIMRDGKDSFETIHRAKDGTLFNMWINVVAVELVGKPHLIAVYHDITERKRYEERLEILANYDPLTGLANRSLLFSHLQNYIVQGKRHKTQIGLIMFDLDRFKDINDSYGHSAGDEVLQQVAERFGSRLREGDIISRLGGDEFAVIVDNLARPEDAGRLAEEMISALESGYRLSGGALIHIGASAGIVLFPDHGESASELLQHGDAALYKAKAEGRGRYRYYTDELTDSARRRIECETRLRYGIKNEEFEVYYQPQVHIQTGRIVGAEALIRWNDPIRGIVSPVEFIPIAEETGLIGEIGEWVLNETCRQGKVWLDQGHRLTLAVNLSAHQVRHQNIPEMVERALKISGYPADRLELELTESALMQREEETVSMLHALRAHGIRLAIDDFGTGYSSLSYLKRFPIDVLKIDKSFVDDIPYEKDDMAIVTAIIAMGQALGFQVLAEGTERIEQIDFLREKGCTMYQGYFKSPPIPAAEFEKLLI